jgi:hypothetical protein
MPQTCWTRCLGLLPCLLIATACEGSPTAAPEPVESADPVNTVSEALLSGNSKVFGLGVDAPTAVQSPWFAKLKAGWKAKDGFSLQSARTVLTITGDETAFAANRANLENWAQTVEAFGLTPVIAIALSRNSIDHATYRARFRSLLGALPNVEGWAMANEPELNGFSGPSGVASAVEFYEDGVDVLEAEQRHGTHQGVQIWAGEFSYQGLDGGQVKFSEQYWEEYGTRMFEEVKARRLARMPRIWGFHPYWDTTRGDTQGTQRLGDFLSRLEVKAHERPDTFRVWLTETGTMLQWWQPGPHLCADSGDEKAQFDGARAVYALAAHKRVDRIYWWQFQQGACDWGGYWDSGMVDWNGAPRPAFCALANLPESECTGDDVSRDCGGVGKGNCP